MHDTIGTSPRLSAYRGVPLSRASLVLFGAGQSAAFIALPIVFRQLDIPESAAGLVFGLASVVSIFSAPLLGRRSDALGRRYVLAGCLTAYGIATFLFGLALYYFTAAAATMIGIVAILLGIRIVAGGMGSGIFPACQGYLADCFASRDRLRESGRLSAAMNFGLLSGALALSAFGALGWRAEWTLLAIGVAAGGFGAFLAAAFPDSVRAAPGAKPPRVTAGDSRIRLVILLCIVFVTVQGMIQQMLGFLVQDRLALAGDVAAFWTGLCFIAAVVASMVSQALLVSRVSGRLVLPAAFIVAAAALFMAARAGSGVELIACLFVTGLAFGFVFPTLMGLASIRVSREEQGGVAGVMVSMSAFGMAAGPISGGLLYQLVGPPTYAIAAAVLALLAVMALLQAPPPE